MNRRKRHYVVEKLSTIAQKVVEEGLRGNATYEEIIGQIKKETGETLAVSSLQRYHARRWFPNRQILEETNHLYGLVREQLEKSQGKKLDEVSTELLKTLLFNALSAIKDPDPLKLYQLVISEGWLDVEKEKLGIHRGRLRLEQNRVEILEGRLEIAREKMIEAGRRAEKAAEKVDVIGKRKKIDPDTMRVIKEEIYGIVDPST